MQYAFGSGVLYGRSLTNANGTTNATPTPVRFGGLQEVSIDISFTTKELYGQYQFPIALGRGTGKITGKAKYAQFNAQAFNDLFFGLANPSTGEIKTAVAEAATVTSNAINVSHNTTFQQDMGVVYSANGAVLSRVAAGPLVGNYSVNESTGAYTFNNADNNVAMLVSYTWNDASNGKKISMTNQLLGQAPQFLAVMTETFSGKQMTMVLNACMSSKLTLATKLEDFIIPEFDFEAFADSGNNIGSFSMEE